MRRYDQSCLPGVPCRALVSKVKRLANAGLGHCHASSAWPCIFLQRWLYGLYFSSFLVLPKLQAPDMTSPVQSGIVIELVHRLCAVYRAARCKKVPHRGSVDIGSPC